GYRAEMCAAAQAAVAPDAGRRAALADRAAAPLAGSAAAQVDCPADSVVEPPQAVRCRASARQAVGPASCRPTCPGAASADGRKLACRGPVVVRPAVLVDARAAVVPGHARSGVVAV